MSRENPTFEEVDRPAVRPYKRMTGLTAALARTASTGRAIRLRTYIHGGYMRILRDRGLRLRQHKQNGAVYAWCEPLTNGDASAPEGSAT